MKVAELYQGYNGEFFEILSFSDNAACIISANTGVYSAVAKPFIFHTNTNHSTRSSIGKLLLNSTIYRIFLNPCFNVSPLNSNSVNLGSAGNGSYPTLSPLTG